MNICIFGDSITYGGYDPVNAGWATLLRNYLEDKYYDVNTYNLGICGDDTAGLLKRFGTDATPRNPDIIIIAIGANDVKHQLNTPVLLDTFRSNLEELISQANSFTKNIILVGIPPVDESLTTPSNKPPYNYRENKDIEKCNQILTEIAHNHKLVFIPIPKDFSTEDLADGLHPNTTGYKKIFETIRPQVEKLVSQTISNMF